MTASCACACKCDRNVNDRAVPQGGIAKQAEKQLSGIENWHVTRQQVPYIDLFQDRRADLVYLTADSPNELSELDSSKLYIIGGIVDRNRHKNICYNKAVSQVMLPCSLRDMALACYVSACMCSTLFKPLWCVSVPAAICSHLLFFQCLIKLQRACLCLIEVSYQR